MSDRFEGKVALVTGAGSGHRPGRRAAPRRRRARRSSPSTSTRDRLDETKGLASGEVAVRQADLSDPDECVDVVAALRRASSDGSTSSATSPASTSPSTRPR